MRLLLAIIVLAIFLGPLRPWVGRHWAFLVSVTFGSVIGFCFGAFLLATTGASCFAALPLITALIGAVAAGQSGPSLLRHIGKDGKDE